MGLLKAIAEAPPPRRPVFILLLAIAIGFAAAPDGDPPRAQTPAQTRPSFSLAEVRQIQAIREQREARAAALLVKAAQVYLKEFPQGRYREETLMALAEGHANGKEPRPALAAYRRIIEEFPDSPFREQAMEGSISLLQQAGQPKKAEALARKVLQTYPNSLFRGRTLLWRAAQAFGRKEFKAVIGLLNQIEPRGELQPAEKAEYYRLAGWARHKAGQTTGAWPFFLRYLEQEDSGENQAPVAMLMGGAYSASGEHAKALAMYGRVIEQYPEPGHVNLALYRRAELFSSTVLESAPDKQRKKVLSRAISYYGAYLKSGDENHLEPALKARAALLMKAGLKVEALADFKRLIALHEIYRPDSAILIAAANLLAELNRGREGVALFTRPIENPATPRKTHAALAVERAALQYRLKDCPGVLAGLNPLPVFSDGAQRRRAFFLRGFCLFRAGEWEKASWDLEGLVYQAEYVKSVWPALAEAYEKSGQFSRLVNASERLLETGRIEPTEELFVRLGRGYEKLGQPAMMLSAFQRLGKLNPEALNDPEVQVRMGRAEEAIGNLERAEGHYLAVVEGPWDDSAPPPPAYLEALERLQGIHLNRGQFEQLTVLNQKAAARVADSPARARIAGWQATAYFRWGRANEREGEAAAAGGHYEAAWRNLPLRGGGGDTNDTARLELLITLTRSYTRAGNHRKARDLFDSELSGAQEKGYRARVSEAFGRFHLEWAREGEAGSKKVPVETLIQRYRQAMRLLPREKWRLRYQAALGLDGLFRQQKSHARRAKLFDRFAEEVPDEELREQLRLYRSTVYGDWSRQNLQRRDYAAALKLNSKAVALLRKAEWKPRYHLLSARGEIRLKQGSYSQLLIEYEKFLPEIQDPGLSAQVNHFVGQVYLTWAERAKKAKNSKSTRIRAHRALDYLPASDWERRLAATRLLAAVFEAEKKTKQAAALYAELIPLLPAGKVRRQYALFLGRQYIEKLKLPREARKWLPEADGGDNGALSVEAVYLLADLERSAKKTKAALALLEELKGRGLQKSKWKVPVYSRLAVLYHQRNDLERALAHYQVVAKEKSATIRKLYPRSISLAKEQVAAIRNYLKFRGGKLGKTVAVPKLRR